MNIKKTGGMHETEKNHSSSFQKNSDFTLHPILLLQAIPLRDLA